VSNLVAHSLLAPSASVPVVSDQGARLARQSLIEATSCETCGASMDEAAGLSLYVVA